MLSRKTISVMCGIILPFASTVFAQSEDGLDDEFALLQEEDIIFTAAKHEQDITDSPSAITVITREQIENTHCTDVICLLRMVPEVDVRRLRPAYAAVGARALTDTFYGDKVLALIDGREVNVDFFGVPLWQALPIHLEDIERIEVIRGPGSALYGPNAHSMVVSIATRKIKNRSAEIFLSGGEHDRTSLSLRLDQQIGDFRLHLSSNLDTQAHWQQQDQRERGVARLRLRAEYETSGSTTWAELGLVRVEGNILTSLGPAHIPPGFMGHANLAYETELVQARLSYSFFDTDFNADVPLYYGNLQLGEFPPNLHVFSSSLNTDVQLNWSPFSDNLLIAGANYRWFTTIFKENDPEESHEHRLGIFLHDEQRLFEDLIITGSLRFDYNNITEYALSPRLAVVWKFSDQQLVRAAFGRAFRKPCFFNTSTHFTSVSENIDGIQQFFHDNIGNDDLGNESITAFEIGYRAHFLDNSFIVEADVFYNLYRDTINFKINIVDNLGLPNLPESTMQFTNAGREVDSLGGSLSLTYRIKETLRINANYTFRHSWFISDPLDDQTEGASKGERVAWEPAHLFNFSFHYLHKQGLRLGLAIHAKSSSVDNLQEDGGILDPMIKVYNPPTWFVSGFFGWRFVLESNWLEAGVRAFNVLNIAFRDTQATRRPDGVELGGELIGRRLFFYLRGTI
ncbi:MAG: TonB-dependent receptor [Deltaproteobacteria bacterium]|nr:TonB-dependent receptor [Deltaproteobacteria bacterium]